jgi:hypothetical protein
MIHHTDKTECISENLVTAPKPCVKKHKVQFQYTQMIQMDWIMGDILHGQALARLKINCHHKLHNLLFIFIKKTGLIKKCIKPGLF